MSNIVDINEKEMERQAIHSLELIYYLQMAHDKVNDMNHLSASEEDLQEITKAIWVLRETIKTTLGIEEVEH